MREIIINNKDDDYEILFVEDGELVEIYSNIHSKKRMEGNIYIGRVQNVVPGLQAAFIDIGESKNVFIHLKDILPKEDSSFQIDEMTDYNSLNIKDYVKQGMPLLVQIKKDGYNNKGAKVSVHINLPGRFVVLLPNSPFVTASQKIEDENEKERLLKIVKKILPDNMGAIVRTAAVSKSEEDIDIDIDNLISKWNQIIKTEISDDNIPKVVYENGGLLEKILVDLVDNNLDRIIVNDKEIESSVKSILKELNKEDFNIIFKDQDLLDMYQLRKNILDKEKRKVWLKSGGFITIDKTEALTAIDVNSGKFTGKDDVSETAVTVNREAAIEIAKQIRLRDIGGIIIVDFIDMNSDKSREEIIEVFSKESKKDRSRVQIEGFTKLDLLEMTRKHICSK
ncbi:MAG: Rne/Rng family ribonuclease [Clostridia bacterium]|nr:Rne/Rng family ribonuclease [Clostridia bacterium]